MALTDRPKLTPDEKAKVLERYAAKYGDEHAARDEDHDDDVVRRQLGIDLADVSTNVDTPDRWHDLGTELDGDLDPLPANADGVAALVQFFALLEERRPAWQRDALCIEYADTVTWFPSVGESTAEAKAVCSRCLVADECKSYALEIDARDGLWAGTSARALKRDAA